MTRVLIYLLSRMSHHVGLKKKQFMVFFTVDSNGDAYEDNHDTFIGALGNPTMLQYMG